MTIHIVPVGLSLADTLSQSKANGSNVLRETKKQWKDSQLGFCPKTCDISTLLHNALGDGVTAQGSEADLQKLEKVTTEHEIDQWGSQNRYSAELDAMKAEDPNLNSDDLILLLASDTHDGLLCAALNALALAKGDLDLIWYRHSVEVWPQKETGDSHKKDLVRFHRRQIIIVCVNNLDVKTKDGFNVALKDLTSLGDVLTGGPEKGTEKIHRDDKEEVRFHLTGGYRTTLPYLLAVAEWVKSLSKNPVSAHLIPEKDTKSTRIPLRWLNEDQVRSELNRFSPEGHCGQTLPNSYLLGYAYEEYQPGNYRLTEFGTNMRRLFSYHKESVR
ncbi:hypothetical protein GCM10007147_04550 [Nocardiopsis kunsanensis]|uniref:CRISPR-associated protein n=1 Tax=Nocardiopsis kunsanensis TaxID=141693 RepID=A0A918X7T1_9ACTN|nr:hypothetical protein [Nocardiopsis kunsanensis]GHD16445.1 hypothetical protein GCM10007147_04550 [Nocardiopsis kunsanensis]